MLAEVSCGSAPCDSSLGSRLKEQPRGWDVLSLWQGRKGGNPVGASSLALNWQRLFVRI